MIGYTALSMDSKKGETVKLGLWDYSESHTNENSDLALCCLGYACSNLDPYKLLLTTFNIRGFFPHYQYSPPVPYSLALLSSSKYNEIFPLINPE